MVDVRLPDGRIVTNVPEGITKSQLMAKLAKLDQPAEQPGGGIMENLQAFGKGASMGLLPKAQALGMTALDQLQNPQMPLAQSYADAKQAAAQLTNGASPLSEIAGGIISPIGNKALAGMKGATLAQKAATGAKSGALLGATYGAGDLNNDILTGDPSAVIKNAAIGGGLGFAAPVVGAGVSAVGSKIGTAIAPKIAPEALQTAQQFNVPLTVDQVAGGRVLPAVAKVSSQAALTGAPLRKAYTTTNEAIGTAVNDVAGAGVTQRIGKDKNLAGDALTAGYKSGLKSVKNSFSAKYDRVYDMVPKNTPLAAQDAATSATEILTSLGSKETAAADGFGRIWDKAQAAVQSRDISQSRRLVTELDGIVAGNMGNEKGMMARKLRDALRSDIDGTVSAVSPEAGDLLQRTNRQYAKFKDLQTAAERIVSTKKGKPVEQAANNFISKIGQGSLDQKAILSLKKFVPKEEWGQFADYTAQHLGDLNGSFDAGTFARNVDKLGSNALEAVFNGGKASDLRNLVNLIKEIKPQVVNPSGTAAAGSEMLAAGAGLFNPIILKGLAGNYALNRTLASPKLAKAYVRLLHSVKNGQNTNQAVQSLVKMGEDPNALSQFIRKAPQSVARPLTIEITPKDKAGGM